MGTAMALYGGITLEILVGAIVDKEAIRVTLAQF
jgi:hypothetical protein